MLYDSASCAVDKGYEAERHLYRLPYQLPNYEVIAALLKNFSFDNYAALCS